MALSDILSSRLPELTFGLIVLYFGQLLVYRLFFHPLRHFPGDRLSVLTKWTWDYNASDTGYLERLHVKYGPVVRICPNELHFSDPNVYNQIYHSASKFTKDPHFYTSFGEDQSSFCFRDPREAKIRKDIINPLFSRRAILKLEPVMQEKVDTLMTQVLSYKDQPVDLFYAFRSTTLDIISSYCFAHSWSATTYPSFQHPILISMNETPKMIWFNHAFPLLKDIIMSMPAALPTKWLPSNMQGLLAVRATLSGQIDKFLADPLLLQEAEHETVYHHLMTPTSGKGHHDIPTRDSLLEEAQNLMFAGSDTVGNASTVGTFHVVNNKQIHAALLKELDEAWPDITAKCEYETLEKLPYLTAVIKESLRMSHGAVSPLPRVVGPGSAEIGGVHVPQGTTVSMSAASVHCNSDIFPNPKEFKPERWLQPSSRELENYLVAFSRGPRSCLGINLAWCELYLILGNIFRKVDMEVYDTTPDDFEYKSYFLPHYTGKHFRAKVRERTT